ncbi:MAG: hypothetical protein HQL65_03155 [Magnetococcales bacterium]|nr:hypothetical protein [Magnetococcales bacterium]
MPPDNNAIDLGDAVSKTSAFLLRLDPGPLARLRRMDAHGPGESDFWQLAGRCGFLTAIQGGDEWLRLVKIMALLVPKGDPANRGRLHQSTRAFGAVLCDGGQPGWPGERPFLSENRLARFLSLPTAKRGAALEGMVRMLAASRAPDLGVNCLDIAYLLFSNKVQHTRKLASTYYDRLDSKSQSEQKESAA